jgi:formamidopyrimidine-DNA glycosylase
VPELPEVETIARRLRRSVIGRRVAAVSLSGMPLRRPIAADFAYRLRNRVIRRVHRRGKYLILEMNPRAWWLVHLGMSGRLLYNPPGSPAPDHTHAIIRFCDQSELHYRDPRRFGLLALYETPRLSEIPELSRLGRDPLSSRITPRWLWPLLSGSRRPIKAFLLDQRRIAGLGNIYVCEALHLARIHPGRRCDSITHQESARLATAVRHVIRKAAVHHGTSFSDFVDSDGRAGSHQRHLRVYQREGRKCPRCPAAIRRLIQSNRSSFFCPHCQPEKG